MELNYGHVAVFIFIVLPLSIALWFIFRLGIKHVTQLKTKAQKIKNKIGE